MAETKTEDKVAKQASTEIAVTTEQTAVAAFNDDDFFGIDTGMDQVTTADVTLPRYVILQGLSPQVNSRKDEYIEGAKMGMILNTATGKVMDSQRLVFA